METIAAPSTARVALRFGLYISLASIILFVVLQLTGLADGTNTTVGTISSIITLLILPVAGIVMAIKYFREENGNFISYGQGMGLGTLTCAVYGIISGLFTLIYLKFIDDSSLKKGLELARTQMEEQGRSDAEIDKAMEMSSMFMKPEILFFGNVFFMLILGLIYSLIIAAIMKKDREILEV